MITMTATTGGIMDAPDRCDEAPTQPSAELVCRTLHRYRRQLHRSGTHSGDLVLGQRDQPLVGEIAILADRGLAGELGDIFADAGDHADMRVLDVEEQRARDRVLAVR